MWHRKRIAAFALVALAAGACSPDEYPTESRFEPPPEEVEIPDGELFFYEPPAGVSVSSVSLRGSFNEWGETPMIELLDGRWVAGVELEPGEYEYKYFFNGSEWAGNMCNDGTWGDPDNEGKVDAAVEECTDGGNGIRQVGDPTPAGHTFIYNVPDGVDVTQVNVVGSLNSWTAPDPALEMAREFSITVDLAAGTYEYKYFFNGGTWADNMCSSTTWGDATNSGKIDPEVEECTTPDNNAILVMDEAGSHTFRYPVPDGVEVSQVNLVGSLNGWSAPDPAMQMDQQFSLTMELAPGDYEYKYFFNGATWADNMCNSPTWGDPANEFKIAPDVEECTTPDNNAILVIEE